MGDAELEQDPPLDGTRLDARTRELFGRWRDGDPHAAAALFELHERWLREQIGRGLGSRLRAKVECDDVAQDVGLRLLRYLPKEDDGAVDRFRGLLRSMATHVIGDLHRHHFGAEKRHGANEIANVSDSRLALDPPRQSPKSPSAEMARLHDLAVARLAFWFVEEEKRDLVALRTWYETPFSELVPRFGAEEPALRMRHMRATQEYARVLTKVRAAFAGLTVDERDLLTDELGRPAATTSSSGDSRVLACSRVRRFAAFLAAIRRMGELIAEPYHPLPDGWPRVLREAPRPAPP